MNDTKTFLLLPSYNEGISLNALIKRIEKLPDINDFIVVFVDDGSTDGTYEYMSSKGGNLKVQYIKHEINMGLGKSLQSGLSYILENSTSNDIVVTMDSDNTHDPAQINEMRKLLSNNKYDLVIGSRYIEGGQEIGVPKHRIFLSRAAAVIFKLIFRKKGINDYTSGYRVFSAGLLHKYYEQYGELPVMESGFASTCELLLNFCSIGASIVEFPIILRYDYKSEKSNIKIIKTVMRYMALVVNSKKSG